MSPGDTCARLPPAKGPPFVVDFVESARQYRQTGKHLIPHFSATDVQREMSKFPYAGLPKHQIWKRAVSDVDPDSIDPQIRGRFAFSKSSRVSSAGSCFAVRLADGLRQNGYSYFVAEDGPPDRHFGRYSARYGDIYTTLQLAQLAQRCVGTFGPREPAWLSMGRYHDPLRPRVEPLGFAGVDELEADRAAHLAATRRVFTESDVFIFTLGLTETWTSREDGAAFPLCPGAGIGVFDDERYAFRNLTVDENVAALETFLDIAWSLNPKLRILLTVSPVPLTATMEPRHVIASTMYSKSVLRVAAETLRARYELVDYFASYEIVTAGYARGASFGADGREVLDCAVERVMRSFFAAYGEAQPAAPALPVMNLSMSAIAAAAAAPRSPNDPCDEAYLAGFISKA
jgi:hypothetical protein